MSFTSLNSDTERHLAEPKKKKLTNVMFGVLIVALCALSTVATISSIRANTEAGNLRTQQDDSNTKLRGLEEVTASQDKTISSLYAELANIKASLSKQEEEIKQIPGYVGETDVDILKKQTATLQLSVTSLEKGVPPVCNLVCQNGGVPDKYCVNCTKCASGFSGRDCGVPTSCQQRCDAKDVSAFCTCQNGGTVDSTCNCKCVQGWTGTQCQTRDAAITDEQRKAMIKYYATKAKTLRAEMLEQTKRDLEELGVTTSNLVHHVGLGIISVDGSFGAPVVAFDYVNKARSMYSPNAAINLKVPDSIQFSESPEGLYWPLTSSRAFTSYPDYLEKVNGWMPDTMGETTPHAVAGLTEAQIQSSFFTGDRFLVTTQQMHPIYTVELMENTADHTYEYIYDEYFAAAMDYIPKRWEDVGAPDLYDALLTYWGNTVIVKSSEGGVLEQLSAVKAGVFNGDYTVFDATEDAKALFYTSASGHGSYVATSKYFQNHFVSSAYYCAGGDAPTRQTCQNSVAAWVQTLYKSPVPVKYQAVPLSRFVADPQQKRAMMLAEAAFLSKHKGDLTGGCPTCAHGTCTAPNKFCVCPGGFSGRTCSTCKPGWQGVNCDVPTGILWTKCTAGQNRDLGVHRFCALGNELWCTRVTSELEREAEKAEGKCSVLAGTFDPAAPEACTRDNLGGCTYYGVYQNTDGHWWCQIPSNAYGVDIVCGD